VVREIKNQKLKSGQGLNGGFWGKKQEIEQNRGF